MPKIQSQYETKIDGDVMDAMVETAKAVQMLADREFDAIYITLSPVFLSNRAKWNLSIMATDSRERETE